MRKPQPPHREIAYRPSRAKQAVFLAILLVVFVVSFGLVLVLWPLDARDFENIVIRMVIHNLKGLLIVIGSVLGAASAVAMPILAIQMLLHRPAFTLTPDGVRLSNGVVIEWIEIDEIHEHVDRTTRGPIQQVLIGLYLRDDDAIAPRLGAMGRWQMRWNKKHGLPPIALATQHLAKTVPEILDDIEDYLAALRDWESANTRWPSVYRRQD